ncbi:MAG: diguanylate cyclase [Bdellovibrionota bacterium]|nr:MAG: diguanylate cyclase [Pseudomonadota bacterium]
MSNAAAARILFVLDDSKEQAALEKSFSDTYTIDFCYDAADTIHHIETTRPEVVVLNFQDDEMSPLAIAHIVREDRASHYVGLIYISRTESNDWLDRLIAAGVDICLPENRTQLQTQSAIASVLMLCSAKAEVQQFNQKLFSAYQRLKNQSFTDSVTGYGNRLFLQNQLRLEFKRAQRYQKHLILLLLRIDNFSVASQPSVVEESVLTQVSETIGSSVRFEIDFTGRSRESEFFVILPETDIDGAISVAERMRARIAKLHQSPDGKHLASSVGVAHFNGDRGNFENSDEFYQSAEAAVAAAQDHGGDQYMAVDSPAENQVTSQIA